MKADGTVIDCLKTLKKDNTGYHLKHLFIGSEGTLGVVTKVAIHCPAMPKAVTLGYFGKSFTTNFITGFCYVLCTKFKLQVSKILKRFFSYTKALNRHWEKYCQPLKWPILTQSAAQHESSIYRKYQKYFTITTHHTRYYLIKRCRENMFLIFYRNPISDFPFYVILETHGSDEDHDKEKLHRFLTNEMKSGLILDGTITSEPSKMQVIL